MRKKKVVFKRTFLKNKLAKLFKNKNMMSRILVTILLLLVYRVGSFIPIPFVNVGAFKQLISGNSFFQYYDLFSGGNFSQFTIFSMGITPYINASIIISLLTMAIPKLYYLQKEGGEQGRREIERVTRWLTVVLSAVQGLALVIAYKQIINNSTPFKLAVVASIIIAGSLALVYIGEKITEIGVGNGVSLIIFISIATRIPTTVRSIITLTRAKTLSPIEDVILIAVILSALLVVTTINESERQIPVRYSGRSGGKLSLQEEESYIPIKVNMAGVIPIIFASSVVLFPTMISQFVPTSAFAKWTTKYLAWGSPLSLVLYVVLTYLFSFYYTNVVFDPEDVANKLHQNHGLIPGIRAGEKTERYLRSISYSLTFWGGLFLAVIAVMPSVLSYFIQGLSMQFGGTSLIIIVGVALETIKQIESNLTLTGNGNGFLTW